MALTLNARTNGVPLDSRSSDTAFPDLYDDKESDHSSSSDDDDDELDWKCCAKDIDFLNNAHTDRHRIEHGVKCRAERAARGQGLDSFLDDVLEETNRKKKTESMLLAMRRKKKLHIINAPKRLHILSNRNGMKSSFCRSPRAPLCRRSKYTVSEPQVDLICILCDSCTLRSWGFVI